MNAQPAIAAHSKTPDAVYTLRGQIVATKRTIYHLQHFPAKIFRKKHADELADAQRTLDALRLALTILILQRGPLYPYTDSELPLTSNQIIWVAEEKRWAITSWERITGRLYFIYDDGRADTWLDLQKKYGQPTIYPCPPLLKYL